MGKNSAGATVRPAHVAATDNTPKSTPCIACETGNSPSLPGSEYCGYHDGIYGIPMFDQQHEAENYYDDDRYGYGNDY